MKRFNTDDLIVPTNREKPSLYDSHALAYERFKESLHDSYIEGRDKFQYSLRDSHVAKYFEHLAKIYKPSYFRDATEDGDEVCIEVRA